ncbi:hypothetical protein PQR53_33165 [Paraburkholderia fungorum]|uniref:hypothetical protein n=1 Tax=Paraburkholderia fungorum TaxID=134537 RepID=UPI0038BB5497
MVYEYSLMNPCFVSRISICQLSEAIMKYEYGGGVIDATPEFSLGQFFAHARIIQASPDDDADTEMHIERNLAWFESEDEATEVGRQWAIDWIDSRDDNLASTEVDSSTRQDDIPANAPAS